MDSFIAWVGGKRLLRKEIVSKFPETFSRYVEVFGGAGWVLFQKPESKNEVYNDINGELVNLFKCMKYHPEAIEKELEFVLNSREMFENYKRQSELEGLTDIQRASRYLYLIKSSYGSKMQHFGASYRNVTNVKAMKDIKSRLQKVVIEHKCFDELIGRYDSEGTLFYCDPPYHNTEKMYDTGDFVFDESQHEKLRDILSGIKGKFILSYNDDEYIRKLYEGFNIEEIERTNNLALRYNKNKVFKELIIRNY
jgi:DNA adenine methylase